jgi:hypothetical protein
MRRQFTDLVPVGVAIAAGLVVLLHQFLSNEYLDRIGGALTASAALVAAFAVLLGLFNVLAVHLQRLAERGGNRWSSGVILLTALVVLFTVLPSGGGSSASNWVFRYLYRPLEAAFLALLVFFMAMAAYRALRIRTWETALFVIAALVVLAGAVPLSNLISPMFTAAREWVLNVPTVAGVRGILFGVALGVLATGLRLLAGIDRPYTE